MEFSLPILTCQMMPLPVFAAKEAAIFRDGDSDGSAPDIPIAHDKASNNIFVLAARSHVVAVVEARRRYAFARGNQFLASAIAVTAIHLSLHRLSQPDAENDMKFEQCGQRLATKVP